jgi:hypothetical protein
MTANFFSADDLKYEAFQKQSKLLIAVQSKNVLANVMLVL